MFQVGVYEELRKLRDYRDPTVLSGSSAGAINAAFIAAGRTPDEMKAFWLSLASDAPRDERGWLRAILWGRGGPAAPVEANRAFFDDLAREGRALLGGEGWDLLLERGLDDVVTAPLRGRRADGRALAAFTTRMLTTGFDRVKRLLAEVRGTYLFGTEALRARLREHLPDPVVPRQGVALAVSAVDVHRGEVIRYATDDTEYTRASGLYRFVPEGIAHDVLLASAAIPLLFEPRWIPDITPAGRRLLWDGGILVNTPLAPAVDLGADRIVPVLATYGPQRNPQELATFGDAVERLADCFLENTYNVDRKLLLTRNVLVAEGVHTRRPVRPARLRPPIRPKPPDAGTVDHPFGPGSYLDFHRDALMAMHRAGAPAVAAWLEVMARYGEDDSLERDSLFRPLAPP